MKKFTKPITTLGEDINIQYEETKYCTECGSERKFKDKYCSNCGIKFPIKEDKTNMISKKKLLLD